MKTTREAVEDAVFWTRVIPNVFAMTAASLLAGWVGIELGGDEGAANRAVIGGVLGFFVALIVTSYLNRRAMNRELDHYGGRQQD